MAEIAVLIPCLNEELTIAQVINDFRRELPNASIYVFDNNSVDATVECAMESGAIIKRELKRGKGNVVRTMFREIDADCYLVVDGDSTYPAESAERMCREVLENGADMVIGDRLSSTYFTENKRMFHSFGNVLVKRLINSLFSSSLKDIMTGYRAFSPIYVKTFPAISKGFDIETEMTVHALEKNFNIVEVPVAYRDRLENSKSKLNTFTDGFKVLITIFDLYKNNRPLMFFSIIAAILATASGVLFIPIFMQYLQTGLVPRIPTLIVSACIMLVSLLCFFSGLILDMIVKITRQDFEYKMHVLRMLIRSKES